MTEGQEFLAARGWREDPGRISITDVATRDEYIRHFGFAIPSYEALDLIRSKGPILEVGAGSGYWSYELQQMGADVIATDPQKTTYQVCHMLHYHWPVHWTIVHRLDALSAMARWPERTLLTVWPDYNAAWPQEMLLAYTGKCIIYVGEWQGCTANDDFHGVLIELYDEVEHIGLPNFSGIHDDLWVFERKSR